MFPWSPEFRWDAGHVFFFGALYSVLIAVIMTIIVSALRTRTRSRGGQGASAVWHADFEDLPRAARRCRHHLTGVAPGRTCASGFDCRECEEYPALAARRDAGGTAGELPERVFGLDMPPDRLYHRGHTWVRPESDGTVTVGLDDLAKRLIGTTQEIALPPAGTRLTTNAPMCRLRSHGSVVRVLAPLDGTVVASRGTDAGFELRIQPPLVLDARHLLSGTEVRAWLLREVDRVQVRLTQVGPGPALADGFDLVPDVGALLSRRSYSALLGDLLLEP